MKMTVFIAVVPQDYQTANVELFETKKEAQQYIREVAETPLTESRSTILEREILFRRTKTT